MHYGPDVILQAAFKDRYVQAKKKEKQTGPLLFYCCYRLYFTFTAHYADNFRDHR